MILVRRDDHHCLVVGLGLVGGAVAARLLETGWTLVYRASLDWGDGEATVRRLSRFVTGIEGRIDLVWAAGRAGFGADESETAVELRLFRTIVTGTVDAAGSEIRLHLMSSAGGLHEGQRLVGRCSPPGPLRAYGRLKLAQEEFISEAVERACIHRLSSVFGFRTGTMRRSLISELVESGIEGRETVIHGTPDTLRDYVYVNDVARFVVETVEDVGDGIHYVVNGRPVSIGEAIAVAGRIHGRPVPVRFIEASNSAPITFDPELRPEGLMLTDLEVAMAQMLDAYRSGMSALPSASGPDGRPVVARGRSSRLR